MSPMQIAVAMVVGFLLFLALLVTLKAVLG